MGHVWGHYSQWDFSSWCCLGFLSEVSQLLLSPVLGWSGMPHGGGSWTRIAPAGLREGFRDPPRAGGCHLSLSQPSDWQPPCAITPILCFHCSPGIPWPCPFLLSRPPGQLLSCWFPSGWVVVALCCRRAQLWCSKFCSCSWRCCSLHSLGRDQPALSPAFLSPPCPAVWGQSLCQSGVCRSCQPS